MGTPQVKNRAVMLLFVVATPANTLHVCMTADMTFPTRQGFKPDAYANIHIPGVPSLTPSSAGATSWSRIHAATEYDCFSSTAQDSEQFPEWCCAFDGAVVVPGAGQVVDGELQPFKLHFDMWDEDIGPDDYLGGSVLAASSAPGTYDLPLQWGSAVGGSTMSITLSHVPTATALTREPHEAFTRSQTRSAGLVIFAVGTVLTCHMFA